MSHRIPITAVFLFLVVSTPTGAQWIPDGNPVSRAAGQQNNPRVVGDTEGGVIVAWTSNQQGGVNYDLFIERYDGFGQRLWSATGMTVCALSGHQFKPAMVPDGNGGAYIAWEDSRAGNYDVYAQHFDASGDALWGANGRVVCNHASDQGGPFVEGPQIVRSDVKDANGVIVCWQDNRNSGTTGTDIYAQRMDAAGAAWAANGVQVCGAGESQSDPQLVGDGSQGAIVVWRDTRAGSNQDDIYAQRLTGGGTVLWPADGVPVCTAAETQQLPRALADGLGGAYVSWVDHRLGLLTPYSAYIHRLDGTGAQVWPADGVQVYGNVEYDQAELVPDAGGGVIVCWRDPRNGFIDIFAQRFTENGTKRWTASGAVVCDRGGDDNNHRVSRDGEGGLYVVWDNGGFPVLEAYIQRVDSTGVVSFAPDGRLVTNAPDRQNLPDVCVDGGQPAFVAWADRRSSNDPDVYLTRIYHTATGVAPPRAEPALRVRAYPTPFNAATEITVESPGAGEVRVEIYDAAGRLVARRAALAGPTGEAVVAFDGRGEDGRALPSGVYLARVRAAGLTETTKIVLTR